MKTDIQIAQEAVMKPITEIAAELDITMDDCELYTPDEASDNNSTDAINEAEDIDV